MFPSNRLRHTKLINRVPLSTQIVCNACGAGGCVRYYKTANPICIISKGWSDNSLTNIPYDYLISSNRIRPNNIKYYCGNCTIIKDIIE
jgi:hypothetical protein